MNVAGQASAKMDAITAAVSRLGANQAEAVLATETAVEAVGLKMATVQVGKNIAVTSVMLGPQRPILLVLEDGTVVRAIADLVVERGQLIVRNVKPW